MTTLEIHGDWSLSEGAHQQRWTMLADADLRSTQGTQRELCLHLATPVVKDARSAPREPDWGDHPIATEAV